MAEEKIYVGNGTSKFDGNQVSCSVCLTDLPQEHMFEYNGKKYIKKTKIEGELYVPFLFV